MLHVVDALVCLDDGDAREEDEEGEQLNGGVRALAAGFGLRGGGRLEDEDCLDEEEDAEGLEQGVRRDERAEGVGEDAGEDGGCEEEDADLGEPACSWFLGGLGLGWVVEVVGMGWDEMGGEARFLRRGIGLDGRAQLT